MLRTDRFILIDAPLETAFEFVADHRNTTSFQKNFSRFEPLGSPTYGLGMTVDARGWVKGIPVRATLKITEFVKNERIVSRSVAHLKSTAEWHFARVDGRTRVRFVASYELPVPILSGSLRERIRVEVDAMAQATLRELKRLLEGRADQNAAP